MSPVARWRFREWKDARGGRWTYKIVWFQGAEPDDIRCRITNLNHGERNIYPQSRAEAERIFMEFRADPERAFLALWERFSQESVSSEKEK